MRAALLIVLGLAIGIVGTVVSMNAIQKSRNPLPHAVMHVMDLHADHLRNAVKAGTCDAASNLAQLQLMRGVAGDIGVAFGTGDAGFNQAAAKLHTALDGAITAAPADCPALAAAMKPVGAACGSCHKAYR